MSTPFAIRTLTRAAADTLYGGRVAVSWQRVVGPRTAPAALEDACEATAALAGVRLPRLTEQPLAGAALQALTDAALLPLDVSNGATPIRQPRMPSAASPIVAGRRMNSRPVPRAASVHRPAATPPHQKPAVGTIARRATSETLRRATALAVILAASGARNVEAGDRPAQIAPKPSGSTLPREPRRPLLDQPGADGRRASTGSARRASPAQSSAEWIERLVGRIDAKAQRSTRRWMCGTERTPSPSGVDVSSDGPHAPRAPHETAHRIGADWLGIRAAWSMGIDGARASAATLARNGEGAVAPDRASSEPAGRARASGPAVASAGRSRSFGSTTLDVATLPVSPPPSGPVVAPVTAPVAHPDLGTRSDPLVGEPSTPGLASQRQGLIPTRLLDVTLTRGTGRSTDPSRSSDDAAEDLDQLAAKIKRILDDEARRHGIDV